MKKTSISLISILILLLSQISASDTTQYLHCSYKNDSLEKNFYWSITSKDKIQRWVSGEPIAVMNSLVMNDQKNIAWNEIGDPLGIFVLDKKTMRQSGTLLSNENKILDRWVSECKYLNQDQFLKME
tara:strand:+ start:3898 stop:4278 length:381 start_codon:yes stop_codon:yes gene_type:complete